MTYTLTEDSPVAMAEELNEKSNSNIVEYLTDAQRTQLETALENYDPDLPVLVMGRYPNRDQLSTRFDHHHGKQPDSMSVLKPADVRTKEPTHQLVVPKTAR